jgi:hypothetical protein
MSSLKKKIFYTWVITLALCICQIAAFAQDDPGGLPDDGCDPFDTTCTASTPLDTWIYVIGAIALIYGYRQLQKQKNSLVIK